jgi:uncharacterized protein YcgI (DUF1989 family)
MSDHARNLDSYNDGAGEHDAFCEACGREYGTDEPGCAECEASYEPEEEYPDALPF